MISVRCFLGAVVLTTAAAIQPAGAGSVDNVPTLSGAQLVSTKPKGAGTHWYYQSSNSAAQVANGYKGQLQSAGWNIVNIGSGGSSWGGNSGLTARKGAAYLVLQAGGPSGQTYINVCAWPSQPDNDNC